MPCYQTFDEGLREAGWTFVPGSDDDGVDGWAPPSVVRLGQGKYGEVILASLVAEQPMPLEYRHLAALKLQPDKRQQQRVSEQMQVLQLLCSWVEIHVLRACVHPNIIGYYTHFVVANRTSDTGTTTDKWYQVCTLIEYASAGDMPSEMSRFKPHHRLPEPVALFYSK